MQSNLKYTLKIYPTLIFSLINEACLSIYLQTLTNCSPNRLSTGTIGQDRTKPRGQTTGLLDNSNSKDFLYIINTKCRSAIEDHGTMKRYDRFTARHEIFEMLYYIQRSGSEEG